MLCHSCKVQISHKVHKAERADKIQLKLVFSDIAYWPINESDFGSQSLEQHFFLTKNTIHLIIGLFWNRIQAIMIVWKLVRIGLRLIFLLVYIVKTERIRIFFIKSALLYMYRGIKRKETCFYDTFSDLQTTCLFWLFVLIDKL